MNRGCPPSADQSTTAAVRSFDAHVQSLLIEGCRQSPTLRRLASERDVLDLYRSVGSQVAGDTTLASPYRTYETTTAIDVAAAVRWELANPSAAIAVDDRD